MSNQLATVEQATQALGVTSSLNPNKAITVSEMESLISQLSPSKEVYDKIISIVGGSVSEAFGSKMVINLTSSQVKFSIGSYPEVIIEPNSYFEDSIGSGKLDVFSNHRYLVFYYSANHLEMRRSIYGITDSCIIFFFRLIV